MVSILTVYECSVLIPEVLMTARSSYKHIRSHQNIQSETEGGAGNKIMWGAVKPGNKTMRGVSVFMGLETWLWGVCLSVWGWKQDYEGCVYQYGAGNRLQTVCHYGAGNKTMRGVSVSMGLGTDYKQSVRMGLETTLAKQGVAIAS